MQKRIKKKKRSWWYNKKLHLPNQVIVMPSPTSILVFLAYVFYVFGLICRETVAISCLSLIISLGWSVSIFFFFLIFVYPFFYGLQGVDISAKLQIFTVVFVLHQLLFLWNPLTILYCIVPFHRKWEKCIIYIQLLRKEKCIVSSFWINLLACGFVWGLM